MSRQMSLGRAGRAGSAWLELLLVLSIVVLLCQFFPTVPQRLLDILDCRGWSRSTWFLVNTGLLLLLLSVRFVPNLIDSWRQRSNTQTTPSSTDHPAARTKPHEDVRAVMRRDDRRRAQLRRKLALCCLSVPVLVIAVATSLALLRNERDKAVRTRNTFLAANADSDSDLHDRTNGVVGLLFHVRPDRDVQVTRLGIYDYKADGMNLAHRVGIFRRVNGQPRSDLLVEATVPYGREAPLEGGFRWVPLDKPLELRAGQTYILAAETFAEVGDDWPAAFDDTVSVDDQRTPFWNPAVVGDLLDIQGDLLLTDRSWPAVPSQTVATNGGVPHGLANMVVADVQ